MRVRGRLFLQLAGIVTSLLATSQPISAQTYPDRPIKIVVPFPAGGPNDVLARLIAKTLSTGFGQPVIVENKAGATGMIGTKAVATAEADGYTLLFGNTNVLAVSPAVHGNVGYDPIRSFAPVASVATSNLVLAINNAFPPKSLDELVAYAKANPGRVNFSSQGIGSIGHLTGEMFKMRTGVNIVHVPYAGTAPSLTDLMAGQVQMTFDAPVGVLPLVRAGKLRVLAVTGTSRDPQAPELPTLIESGLRDVVAVSFFGVVAPAGTPASIVNKLNAAINQSLNSPDMQSVFAKLALHPKIGSPQEFSAFIAAELQKWSTVADAAGIKID
jgi:tripartite-type tricarboxylate transporter receptor subunit TctC